MYRILRGINKLIDKAIMLGLMIVMLIGVYFIYDSAYVFANSTAENVRVFRPTKENTEVLRELSDDAVGWITMDNTNIDYPIMQGETNSEYLNKNPYGDYSLSGSIFLDSRNDPGFGDSYSLIYGHHMTGGYMFGALDSYYDPVYTENHKYGTLVAGEKEFKVTVFAVFHCDAHDDEIFQPEGSSAVFRLVRNLDLMYWEEPSCTKIVALTTCKEPGSTARTVVLVTLEETDE